MLEMLRFCGRRFRVLKRAEKTCSDAGRMEMREFRNNDVVLLGGLRCSGHAHDGCQRGCMLFWKEAWLRKVSAEKSPPAVTAAEADAFAKRFNTRQHPARYFCQSTELLNATRRLSRSERLRKCVREVCVGNADVWEMASRVVGPLWRKLVRKLHGDWPRGSRTKTPTEVLGLRPGELVEVKSLTEIEQTLDVHGLNRGLHFSVDMAAFCGRRYRVRSRLERMISEKTGQMLEPRNTVILEEVTCQCPYTLGGCPRAEFQYWREIWLRRVPTK
jgi:hypothetical protein